MNKKIIAIALIFVLVVTAFTACKAKYTVEKINGVEYALVLDKEDNTIINDEYKVAVYITEEDGNIYKDADGETHTNWIQLQGSIITDDAVKGENYELKCITGWHTGEYEKIIKDETSDSCYIQLNKAEAVSKDYNLKSYIEEIDKQNIDYEDLLAKEGYTITINKEEKTITSRHLSCIAYQYKIVDKDNKVIHYAENYIFTTSKTIYSVDYVCLNGVGYDESFDFESYLNVNFAFEGV